MEDRTERWNHRLNEEILRLIRVWDGTAYGAVIKNAWENGSYYETICELCGIDYEEYKEG